MTTPKRIPKVLRYLAGFFLIFLGSLLACISLFSTGYLVGMVGVVMIVGGWWAVTGNSFSRKR